MKRSKWLILIVILIVIGVVVAKRTRKSPVPSEPVATAQAPAPARAPQAPPAPGQEEQPRSAEPDQPATPEPPDPGKPAATQHPPSQPQPEAAPQPEPKPEGPLPGSKLAECLKNGRPTMADFGAGWCSPCRRMEPVLVEAATKYEGKANVVYVDTDKYAQVARSYHIATIPTQIFFDAKGQKVSQHIGYWPIEDVGRALAAAGVAE